MRSTTDLLHKRAKCIMTKEERESYLDDVQILRNRNMTMIQIAEALGKHDRQISRWAEMLKRERRWRTNMYDTSHRHDKPKDEMGRWISE